MRLSHFQYKDRQDDNTGNDLTCIIEIIKNKKKTRLIQSIVQEVYSVAAYLPRIQVKYSTSTLFNLIITRKKTTAVKDYKSKRRFARVDEEPPAF